MSLEMTEILLENQPSYMCVANCFGNSLQFKFTWVERLGRRSLVVSSPITEGAYLQNTVLETGVEYQFTSEARMDGNNFFLLLIENPMKENNSQDMYRWKDNFCLYVCRYV